MVPEFLLSLLVRIVIPEFPKFVKLVPTVTPIFFVSGSSTGVIVVTAKGLTGGVEDALKSNINFFYYFINCSRGLTASKPST